MWTISLVGSNETRVWEEVGKGKELYVSPKLKKWGRSAVWILPLFLQQF